MNKRPPKAKEFMNVRAIAELFEVNRKSVLDWIAAGKFPGAFKTGESQKAAWIVPTVEVEAFKKERDQAKSSA